jgi:hypothetical protein
MALSYIGGFDWLALGTHLEGGVWVAWGSELLHAVWLLDLVGMHCHWWCNLCKRLVLCLWLGCLVGGRGIVIPVALPKAI